MLCSTTNRSAGENYCVLWHNKPFSRRKLLCSVAQQTGQQEKITVFCGTTNRSAGETLFYSTTNPLTISATPWNCPYGRSDCRRCMILWSLFESKVFSWWSACSYFATVRATILLNGVRSMKC